ncbi:MAG: barstar family protein [Pyrinomonadaceae bacterium]
MSEVPDNFYQRLDYQLLRNGPVNLYYSPDLLEQDLNTLKELKYEIDEFDCSGWKNPAEMHEQIARKLDFPEYYGKNLDALNDCLSAIEIPEMSGRALVFRRFEMFSAIEPKVAWNLLDIIAHNAWTHLVWNERLFAMVQSSDPNIRFDNLGSHSASWKN